MKSFPEGEELWGPVAIAVSFLHQKAFARHVRNENKSLAISVMNPIASDSKAIRNGRSYDFVTVKEVAAAIACKKSLRLRCAQMRKLNWARGLSNSLRAPAAWPSAATRQHPWLWLHNSEHVFVWMLGGPITILFISRNCLQRQYR